MAILRGLAFALGVWFVGGCGAAQVGAPLPPAAVAANEFTDPLLDSGPDPWVVSWKGFYYYSNSTGTNLTLRKTADITDLRHAETKAVWTPEPGHAWSKDVWAPELHRWGNKWYLYFAADAGENQSHRIFVVENANDDPMQGTWTMKGEVNTPDDHWAIDATTFELRGQHYMVWSGWQGSKDGEQDLFIAHMRNAWTLDSPRTLISKPTLPWETHGDLPGRHVNVNEGPEFITHGSKMFIVFSASGCWTDNYGLGALEASANADPLNANSWVKIAQPFLSTDAASQAFSPGHNGFFKSPNGQEDWIIYHANPGPGEGCESQRSPRIQKFTWDAQDRPVFGDPMPLGTAMQKPAQ